MSQQSFDPYRVLFPLGILAGIVGAGMWILFGAHLVAAYPGLIHPDLMMGGFLFAFVAGFLMTAVPRLTASFPASRWEIALASMFVLATTTVGAVAFEKSGARILELTLLVAQGAFLALFCVRRFVRRRHNPPPAFSFIAMGLACAIAGPLLMLASEIHPDRQWCGLLGRAAYYHGMVLAFVIGVGSRLVPAFFGFGAPPTVESLARGSAATARAETIEAIALAFLFLASFLVEIHYQPVLGRSIRAAVMSFVGLVRWRLYRRPVTRGTLPAWLRVCGMMIVIGLWIYALAPGFAVHAAHLVFIGGFSLLAILVATRVVLSHGGYGTALEKNSPWLRWSGTLLLAAAMTRAVAPLTGHGYISHLVYSSVTWIAAMGVWAIFAVPRIVRRPTSQ